MRAALIFALLLAGCGTTYDVPVTQPEHGGASNASTRRPLSGAISDYRQVAPRVERSAEAFCREEYADAPPRHCDFEFRLVDDPDLGPNAFQTMGEDGRPLVVMTTQLLRETGGSDEIAFVLAHETGHHIASHLPKVQGQSLIGAVIFGTLAAGGGASQQTVADMMDLGASIGGRAYSQTYELEADVVGSYIAARAGYDPERGAVLFSRSALAGGGGLLSTHPASPQRQATVSRVSAEIRRQQAAGLTPRPQYAGGS